MSKSKTNYDLLMDQMEPSFMALLIRDYKGNNPCKKCTEQGKPICDSRCFIHIWEWLTTVPEVKDVSDHV